MRNSNNKIDGKQTLGDFARMFKQPSDHNKWSNQIEYASTVKDINETNRTELVLALNFLKKELGNGFLKTSKLNHPVRQKITNRAEWQVKELISFVNTLKALKANNSNYPKLIQKLLAFEKSKIEGIPFVEIAESFLMVNFHVSFPDEIMMGKSPDIKIVNPDNNDEFLIEVSIVNDSDERNSIQDNYYFLLNQFQYIQPIFLFTGKQKKQILKEQYSKIQKIISDAKLQIEKELDLVSFSDEWFEFTLAPFDKISEFDKICEQNGTRSNNIIGLDLNFDETERIISKLKHEVRQIPHDCSGLIYFKVNPIYFMLTDIGKIVLRLQDYVSQFTNIFGIVLFSKIISTQEEIFIESEKHVFRRKKFEGIVCHELLFVYNYDYDVKLKDETIQKIYQSFK